MGGEIVHEWDLLVKSAVLGYNSNVHSSTGVTTFYAMYGREAILPVDWVYSTPDEREQTMFSWTETSRRRFQEAYQGMRQKQNRAVQRNAQLYKPLT